MKNKRLFTAFLLFFVVLAAASAFAGDRDFRRVVDTIEASYGVHHLHIPMIGLALFFARGEGVSGMKLAVFEDFPTSASTGDLSRLVEKSLGEGWYPFVRVRSNEDRETTLIYASPSSGKMRMMIVNIEPSEATVVEMNLSERSIQRWLKDPGENAESQSGHHGGL